MKIIHLLGWYFPESVGGTEVYVSALASGLTQLGHDVAIAAPLAGLAESTKYIQSGIPVFRYPVPASATRDEAQQRVQVRGTEALRTFLNDEHPDIVHVHSITTGLGMDEMKAARAAGARVIVTSHLPATGYICQRGTLMRWGDSLCDGIAEPVKCAECALEQRGLTKTGGRVVARAGRLLRSVTSSIPGQFGTALQMPAAIEYRIELQQEMMRLIDKLVLLNEYSKRVALGNGAPANKLALNYLGHALANGARKPSADIVHTTLPIRVGYVGRLAEGKGIPQLIDAIESLPADAPIEFEIRGVINNAEAAAIAERVRTVSAKRSNVRLAAAVEPGQIADVLRSYDLLCVPSSSFENGPTVVCEAIAVGTPVLGTCIGAMAEVIRNNVDGRLVTPGDSTELAAALAEISRDPGGTIDLWRANLPEARTMHDVTSDYDALYRDMLAGGGVAR